MLRELVTELALGLRAHVLPHLGTHAARAHVRAGAGGDVTFEIDRHAEAYLESFLAERAPEVAYYSEDRGLVLPGTAHPPQPDHLLADRPYVLLVDPLDGTRPPPAGFEPSCVPLAAPP